MKLLEEVYMQQYFKPSYIRRTIDRLPIAAGFSPNFFIEWLTWWAAKNTKKPEKDITPEDLETFLGEWLEEELDELTYKYNLTPYERREMKEEGITDEVIDGWIDGALEDMEQFRLKKKVRDASKEVGVDLDI